MGDDRTILEVVTLVRDHRDAEVLADGKGLVLGEVVLSKLLTFLDLVALLDHGGVVKERLGVEGEVLVDEDLVVLALAIRDDDGVLLDARYRAVHGGDDLEVLAEGLDEALVHALEAVLNQRDIGVCQLHALLDVLVCHERTVR